MSASAVHGCKQADYFGEGSAADLRRQLRNNKVALASITHQRDYAWRLLDIAAKLLDFEDVHEFEEVYGEGSP